MCRLLLALAGMQRLFCEQFRQRATIGRNEGRARHSHVTPLAIADKLQGVERSGGIVAQAEGPQGYECNLHASPWRIPTSYINLGKRRSHVQFRWECGNIRLERGRTCRVALNKIRERLQSADL